VWECDSLAKRGLEDRLILAHVDLDANRLELDGVPLSHAPLFLGRVDYRRAA
jgi:hypothetical protein